MYSENGERFVKSFHIKFCFFVVIPLYLTPRPPPHQWPMYHASVFLVTIFWQFSRLLTPAPSVTRENNSGHLLDEALRQQRKITQGFG